MGTVLGSLAAGIVMIYLNYLALGRQHLARTITIWGIALTVGLMTIAAFSPADPSIALLLTGVQAGIAYFLAERLQGAAIRYHRQRDGLMHSNLRALGIGLLTGTALFFVLVVVSAFWATLTGSIPAPP